MKIRGWQVGGIMGAIISFLSIIFGSDKNPILLPANLFFSSICSSASCSDVIGFALGILVFTVLFYILIGILLGHALEKAFNSQIRSENFLFLLIVIFIFSPLVTSYELPQKSFSFEEEIASSRIHYAVPADSDALEFIQDRKEKESNVTVFLPSYNNQWDNHILDSTWKVKSNEEWIPLLVGVIQSDQELNDIYVLDANDNDEVVAYTEWSERVRTYPNPWFMLLYVNKNWFEVENGEISIKVEFDIHQNFDNVEGPVKIDFNEDAFPKFEQWFCGDSHHHSIYTNTNFLEIYGELGAPLYAISEIGNALDIDWVTVTDHSNSFNAHQSDFGSWDNFVEDCNLYPNCLIGEEVNCRTSSSGNFAGNSLPGNHILAYNIQSSFLDDGRNNVPLCKDRIDEINNQEGAFAYVAHPESAADIIDVLDIIDTWQNYSLDFKGLEIWNGDIRDSSSNRQDLNNGLIKWKELLLNGRKVFISAGSDAHGDLNKKFGKEMTCVYASTYSKENIFSGLKNGNSYMTNNGALIFSISNKKIGETTEVIGNSSITLNIDYDILNSCSLNT